MTGWRGDSRSCMRQDQRIARDEVPGSRSAGSHGASCIGCSCRLPWHPCCHRPARDPIQSFVCHRRPAACSAARLPPRPAPPQQAASPDPLIARGEYLVYLWLQRLPHLRLPLAPRRGTGGAVADHFAAGLPRTVGTTYATNLRLRMQELDEPRWLQYSGNLRTRPLMPDFAVRAMSEDDRRAIYRFVRSPGATGNRPRSPCLPPGALRRSPTWRWSQVATLRPGRPKTEQGNLDRGHLKRTISVRFGNPPRPCSASPNSLTTPPSC